MTRVTKILDQFPERGLIDWQLSVGKAKAKQVSQDALFIGTQVDLRIQALFRKDLLPVIPLDTPKPLMDQIENCLLALDRLLERYPAFWPSVQSIQNELSAGDYTGHPDFVIEDGDWWGIEDVKCANQIRPTYWTQMAAYAWLKMQMEPDLAKRPIRLAINRLDKVTAQPERVVLEDPAEVQYEIGVWLNYKALYEHTQRVAERARMMKEEEAFDGVS